jgi:hypothetical protein
MTRSSNTKYSSIARTLTLIGAVIAIIGYAISIISIIESFNLLVFAIGVIGIIISILILISVGSVKSNTKIPFTWWMLLIWVIVQALIINYTGSNNFYSLTGVGVLFEAIAMILLLIVAL